MRQPHTAKCPACGKDTFVGRVEGISSVWVCSNCKEHVISAGGYPQGCHNEKVYSLMIRRPTDKQMLVTLASILKKNVLETRNAFAHTSTLEIRFRTESCVEIYHALLAAGISCEMDPQLLRDYPRILDCPYR
jgi:ribosomal protein L37AE/L43A